MIVGAIKSSVARKKSNLRASKSKSRKSFSFVGGMQVSLKEGLLNVLSHWLEECKKLEISLNIILAACLNLEKDWDQCFRFCSFFVSILELACVHVYA